ncbi:cyclin-U1-1 [Cryptomeria japonica]|uniref:cyclin-U1-1 n=1 Tax=Cryptomeria japonica TaxID=3369 RepID=UPI0025AC489B|nr:cyclin-U1-1 [Cryptomeria japonica]
MHSGAVVVCRERAEEEREREREEEQLDETTPPEETQQPRILSVLSCVLQRLVSRNDQYVPPAYADKNLTVFHGVRAPSITVPKYLERIFKYTNCSPSCFVVGYIYIDRLVHRQPDFPVTSLNVHRLLLTSVMIAAKMLDDAHYNNAFYARVGGVSNTELNRLELDLLFRLDFRLKVTGKIFESYCLHLEKETNGQRIERSPGVFRPITGVSSDTESVKHDESKVQQVVHSPRPSVTTMVVRDHPEPPSR